MEAISFSTLADHGVNLCLCVVGPFFCKHITGYLGSFGPEQVEKIRRVFVSLLHLCLQANLHDSPTLEF